ncbi:MAG: hypothetical protein HY550_11480 [Elusimicrobia bacterium]|nr:hypothetical protein [Elusimicrobiota bacterium]
MKKMKLLAAAALCVSFASPGSAEDALKNNYYFETSAVTLTSEETVRDLTEKDVFPAPLRPDDGKVPGAAIVNGGVQAWNVINSGKPDASLSSSYASAIPGFSFNWANYSGWKKKEVVYTYTVTNLMQIDVIKIKYAVSFFYNGQNLTTYAAAPTDPLSALAQGRNAVAGHYITNFTVRPLAMNIKWGWKFSLNVRMSDPMNIATSDDPVAFLQSDLNYIVSTPFSTNGSMWTYAVNGLGAFKDLTPQDRERTGQIGVLTQAEAPAVAWN